MQDFRLPTGDDRDLLGTGTFISRTLAIFSTGNRSFAANVSVGASFATKNLEAQQFVGTPPNKINGNFRIDYGVLPRVTLSADLVGSWRVSGSTKMAPWNRSVQFVRTPNGPVQNQSFSEFQVIGSAAAGFPGQGVLGIKVNPWRNLLVIGNVLVGSYEFGLGHRPALSLGAEYTF
jgi:hypothetical protein